MKQSLFLKKCSKFCYVLFAVCGCLACTQNQKKTTMIGDVDLDDFFPDEQLDSTMVGKSQNEMSLLTFEKSKQYANKKYKDNVEGIHSGKLNYMFLEISKEVRRKIQPIGK